MQSSQNLNEKLPDSVLSWSESGDFRASTSYQKRVTQKMKRGLGVIAERVTAWVSSCRLRAGDYNPSVSRLLFPPLISACGMVRKAPSCEICQLTLLKKSLRVLLRPQTLQWPRTFLLAFLSFFFFFNQDQPSLDSFILVTKSLGTTLLSLQEQCLKLALVKPLSFYCFNIHDLKTKLKKSKQTKLTTLRTQVPLQEGQKQGGGIVL